LIQLLLEFTVLKKERLRGLIPKIKGKTVIIQSSSFIAENKECLHSWFRTGSSYTGNGADEFLKECFSRLPKRVWKVFVRAESGFFNGALLEVLIEAKSEYLIKVFLEESGRPVNATKMAKS
jgi:hypothetical protein